SGMTDTKAADDQKAIVEHFQKLRDEQASVVSEISRVEEEIREFDRVLKLLNELDGDRTCHHLVSDSLVEMKVKEIVPFLTNNHNMLSQLKDSLNENLVVKGKELNAHKEKHNIRFITEKEAMAMRQQQLDVQGKK
ncbi:pfd-2, partial [Pristionchus pacificus]